MKYPDVTAEIEAISRNYIYHKPPDLLVVVQEMIAGALRWFTDVLTSLDIHIPGISDTRMVGTIMQIALYASAVAGLTVFAIAIAMRISYLQKQRKKMTGRATVEEVKLDAAGWRREAAALAGRQEWRLASRALYLAFLRLLDEKGIAAYSPTRTNYEYFYLLAGDSGLQKLFRSLFDRVESAWFGHLAAGPDDYEHCLSIVEESERLLAAGSPLAGRSTRL